MMLAKRSEAASKISGRHFPWGVLFAQRHNFDYGYFLKEGELVKKFLLKPSRVLIIGSGNGREAKPISQGGYKIVCLDIGEGYLRAGKEMFSESGINCVEFVNASMERLPFKDKSFDFIFFSLYGFAGVFRFKILCDVNRILKPRGKALLMATTHFYTKRTGWLYLESPDQLKSEILLYGFKLLEGGVDYRRKEYIFAVAEKVSESKKRDTPWPIYTDFFGKSMLPTLKEGMRLLVDKVEPKDVRLAQIILYRKGSH